MAGLTPPDHASLPPLMLPPTPSAGRRIRNYLLTGIVVAGPLAITVYITWSFVSWVDSWVKPLIPRSYLPDTYLPFAIPGLGLVVAFIGLVFLGFMTANLVGRSMLRFGENLLERMPVVRGIYKSVKQIFETVFAQSGTTFRKVGLVEYPAKDMWSIVFISSAPGELLARGLPAASDQVGVFLPCAPNPTTGFFFYLPRSLVHEISITVDDAAKLVMSAGMIQPDVAAKLIDGKP